MRRHLPLLLVLYVTLDFANPLMPGAVSFVAGSIEVVQADRTTRAARSVPAPARLVPMVPTWSIVPVEDTLAPPAPLPLAPPSRALRVVRHAPPQHLPTAPSPSEDH
jgi:hypothetical protein